MASQAASQAAPSQRPLGPDGKKISKLSLNKNKERASTAATAEAQLASFAFKGDGRASF